MNHLSITDTKPGLRSKAKTWSHYVYVGTVLTVLITMVIVALCGPYFASWLQLEDPTKTITYAYSPDDGMFGADYLGRDMLSRVLHGGQRMIILPFIAALITEFVSLLVAFVIAYKPKTGWILRFFLDVILVTPGILIILVVFSMSGWSAMVLVIATLVLSVPGATRYLESVIRPILATPYVEQAMLAGDSVVTILFVQVVPNLIRPILTDFGNRFLGGIYLIATAAFLGSSVEIGVIDWASMINFNLSGMGTNIWAVALPAICIAMLTLSVNLLADAYKMEH